MHKKILTLLGSALIVASAAQAAVAAQPHRSQKASLTAAAANQRVRDSNAYAAPLAAQQDWSAGYSGGFSAPAGR